MAEADDSNTIPLEMMKAALDAKDAEIAQLREALEGADRVFYRWAASIDPGSRPYLDKVRAALARPVTGFFAGLTAEQKRHALAYRGEEDHGAT